MVIMPEGKKMKRAVKVYTVEGPVYITLTASGIEYKIPKTRIGIFASHKDVIRGMPAPSDIPAHYANDLLKFLQYQTSLVAKRQIKKELKSNMEKT